MHTVVDLYIALQHGEAAVLMCKHGVVQGVHGFGGGFLAEADTECASGFLFGKAQGGNYMAGLSLVAGGAGGDADAQASAKDIPLPEADELNWKGSPFCRLHK